MSGELVIACAECGYDLSGRQGQSGCPECGDAAAFAPALLSGRATSGQLAALDRLVTRLAILGFAGGCMLVSLYAINRPVVRGWSLIPLGWFLLTEAGMVGTTARVLSVLKETGVRLDHARRYGMVLIFGRMPVAFGIALPLAAGVLRGQGVAGEEYASFAAFMAGFVGIGVQALFLRSLVRGVASRRVRRRADDLATLNVVLAGAALVACPVGFAFGPLVLAAGATVNLTIASLFWSTVQRYRRSRG